MNCDDIKIKLQPFLDDLLAEDEYKVFCGHINTCDKCGLYVRSIGSLSNQLWKLGKVRVPEDLGSTIIYKLTHPEQEARTSKYIISKKKIIAGFISASLIITLFAGINYLRTRQQPGRDVTPIVRTEVIHKIESPSESDARSLIKQLETIATNLGVPEKKETIELRSEEENISFSNTSPLHWHFQYAEKSETPELKHETMRRTKLLDILNALSIKLDYQKHDILVFTAAGKTVENALEKILFISEDKNSFCNFTTNIITSPDKENRVSIYLEHNKTGVLHWHIDPLLPGKKSSILDILRELSNSIGYESEELLICSIPDNALEKLKNRIRSTGASLLEYGSVKSQEGTLSSGPITISIYFTR